MLKTKGAAQLTPEQRLLAENFTAALSQPGAPSPGEIAFACEITEQAVSNWKRTGKITAKNLEVVSRLTGWSVTRLLTGRDAKPAPQPRGTIEPPAPPRDFSDRKEVSDTDWGLLEDVKLVMLDDEVAKLRERAAHIRKHQEAALAGLLSKTTEKK